MNELLYCLNFISNKKKEKVLNRSLELAESLSAAQGKNSIDDEDLAVDGTLGSLASGLMVSDLFYLDKTKRQFHFSTLNI